MCRANGTGTVYNLGKNRRNPWIARVFTGYNKIGTRVYKTIGFYRTKSQAIDALDKARFLPLPERPNITFSELFNEWNISTFKNLSDKSIAMYNTAFSHLAPLHDYKSGKQAFIQTKNAYLKRYIAFQFRAILCKV